MATVAEAEKPKKRRRPTRFEVHGVMPLADLKVAYCEHAIRVCGGNTKEAAQALDVSYRTLVNYGLTKGPRRYRECS